jgi:cobalt-zinc-cadmium efflux system outer membrane protein
MTCRASFLLLAIATLAPAKGIAHPGHEQTPPAAPINAADIPARATVVTPISDIVTQTLSLNPEIRFYENEIASARTRHETAGRWPDPELSVEIGRKSSRNADGSYAGDGLSWGVTLAQRFDFSGRNALRKAIALRQIERAEAGLAQFRRELAARSAELAHALLAAQQRLDATEEVAARGHALLSALVQREPSGVTFLLESRILEAAVRKLARDAATRRAELTTALADLNMLRGLAPATPLRVAASPSVPAPAPDDSALLAATFRENHSLRQFELDLAEQGVALDIERRNAFNDVTLSAYYNEEKAGGKDRFVGLGVTVPLPLWNRNGAAIAEAKTRQGQAEGALFKLRRDLHKDTLAAAALYRASAKSHLDNGPAVVARFHEAAELAERHYRLGTIQAATYLDLQQAYLDIIDTHVSTRVEALRAAAQLSILTGLPLEKFFPQKTSQEARERQGEGERKPESPTQRPPQESKKTASPEKPAHTHPENEQDAHSTHTNRNIRKP